MIDPATADTALPRAGGPREEYRRRAEAAAVARASWRRRADLISNARLILFFAIVGSLAGAAFAGSPSARLLYSLAALLGATFVGLVVHHARVERRVAWQDALWGVNHGAGARVDRRWDELARLDPPEGAAAAHPYAADLDLFGRASLFQLLAGGLATSAGRRRLAEWLLAPAGAGEIAARQQAVAELAPLLDFRQELAAHGRLLGVDPQREVHAFLEWGEAAPGLIGRRWLVWTTRLLTVAIWTFILLNAAGLVPYVAWAILLAPSLLLTGLLAGPLYGTLDRAISPQDAYQRYGRLFQVVSEARLQAPALQQRQAALETDRHPAHWHMERLHRIGELGDFRYAAPILHFPIQALTLWDFHVAFALERWQRVAGRRARAWLDALGDMEALAALAGLAHDNPAWSLPIVEPDPEAPRLEATQLAHPLLHEAVRVANDVTVGPPGTFLLVTGSNMSGKSTLLRAIGLNAVLAEAGGPVCAVSMRLPPVRIYTSMRVQDSLEEGLSYFMAALKRLQVIVEAARQPDSRVLLFLLDEILQGTNTAERRIAVRTIVGHLLKKRTIGAITTHDLTLAESAPLTGAARAVHFTETVSPSSGGGLMTFDYRLRPGVATSRNALRLMRLIGLEPGDDQR
jgi:hypothetical protein